MNAKNPKRLAALAALRTMREQRSVSAVARSRRRRGFFVVALLVLFASMAFVTTVVVATPVVAAGVAYQLYGKDVEAGLSTLEKIDQRQVFQSNRVYDRNGVLLLEFWGEGRRIKVPLDQISPLVVSATVATEDKTFWSNQGVDPQAILRAVLQNRDAGGIRSGASTITQQLVRMIVFSYDERFSQSYDRKIKEVALAYLLSRLRSKDEIISLYLNEVNYGHVSYGIEAAAQTFFGKHAKDLDLAEASLLAGLPQSPADLDPLNPDRAGAVKARQRTVLDLMVQQDYITPQQADEAFHEDLHYQEQVVSLKAPHFVNYVRDQLAQMFGPERVAQGGLVVTTTLDLRLQDQVQQITLQHVQEVSATKHLTNASVVVTRPDTGEILAMVGSANYWDKSIDGQVNIATAERQPGSSIKPLLYTMAFSKGLTPGTYIYDQATAYKIPGSPVYKPVNYDGKWHGQVTLRTALANSLNIPATKLMHFVGVMPFIDFAHHLGISGLNRGPSWYGISLALGGGEVKLVDMVTAYGVIANQGDLVHTTPFLKIVDTDGNVLYQLAPERTQVVDPRVTFMVSDIMSDDKARVMEFGVNTPLHVSRPAAVKTGTTNDWKDNWTIGFTPYALVGVWAGNADNTSMHNSTGVTGAAPIWHDTMELIFSDPQFMKEFYPAGDPPLGFAVPDGVVKTTACVPTGAGGCRSTTDWFLADHLPGKNGKDWLAGVTSKTYRVVKLSSDGTSYCVPAPDQNIPDSVLSDVQVPDIGVNTPQDVRRLVETLGNVGTLVERDQTVQADTPPPGSEPPACTSDDIAAFIAAGGLANNGEQVAGLSYYISSPAPGETVHGVVPIMGSAVFGSEFVYYKVEIAGPDGNWLTIGSVHSGNVSNGQLEVLHADALPTGQYLLRLVVVRQDSNYPSPYVVPITVGPRGP